MKIELLGDLNLQSDCSNVSDDCNKSKVLERLIRLEVFCNKLINRKILPDYLREELEGILKDEA